MSFQATPTNVLTLLLVAFALYTLYSLSLRKLDSNLTLLFYILVVIFENFSDRKVNTYLVGGGLILALMLRFEFLNGAFTKLLLLLEMLAITGTAMIFVSGVFAY